MMVRIDMEIIARVNFIFVYMMSYDSILFPCEEDIEKWNGIIIFKLHGKFDIIRNSI